MGGSAAEREIREAVVMRLRELMPSARIIHELNVAGQGSNRIDVAAVAQHAIVAVEIKSERDKLDRLEEQWRAFGACCHKVIVAAHRKHFKEWRADWWGAETLSVLHLNHPLFYGEKSYWRHDEDVWLYPRPARGQPPLGSVWTMPREIGLSDAGAPTQPRASAMLGMLWASELRTECARHGITFDSRTNMSHLVGTMVWHMTGREICAAVCRQLRSRNFAEADPAIEVAA